MFGIGIPFLKTPLRISVGSLLAFDYFFLSSLKADAPVLQTLAHPLFLCVNK